jgi:hypothetical protein
MSTPLDSCCSRARTAPQRARRPIFGSVVSLLLGLLAALAPKCPLCLAAYLSIVGVGVTGASQVAPFLLPIGLGLIALSAAGAAITLKRFSARPRPPRRAGDA